MVTEQATQLNSFISFHQEEECLRLKSRSLWLQLDDKNTAFFHRQCKACLSRNHISKIYSSEGEIIKCRHTQLQQDVKIHFQNLFQEDNIFDEEVNAKILSNIPTLVSSKINVGLGKPFFF